MGRRSRRKKNIPAPVVVRDDRIGYGGHSPEFMPARDLVEPGTRQPVSSPQNVNVDRVSWLYAHGHIEARQHRAAEMLQADWELSLIMPVASAVLVGASGSTPQLPGDAKVAAMESHGAARSALGRQWAIVELVVHRNNTVDQAAAILRFHPKHMMGQLFAALDRLADHYRLG